jgi:hypothetical protein
MQTIYVSNKGDDANDGLTLQTPVHSWKRVMQLCRGNQAIFLVEGNETFVRLKEESNEKR